MRGINQRLQRETGSDVMSSTRWLLLLLMVVLVVWTRSIDCAVSCPTGDAASPYRDGLSCFDLVEAQNYECYHAQFETDCCASCNAKLRAGADTSCRYGDHLSTCNAVSCVTLTNETHCCEYCTTTTSTTTPTTTTTTTTISTTSTTPSATTESTTTTPQGSGLSGGAIAGIVIAALFATAATGLAIAAIVSPGFLKRKSSIQVEDSENGKSSKPPESPTIESETEKLEMKENGDNSEHKLLNSTDANTDMPVSEASPSLPRGSLAEPLQPLPEAVQPKAQGVTGSDELSLISKPLPPINSGAPPSLE